MAWPEWVEWPWPPQILRQIYATACGVHCTFEFPSELHRCLTRKQPSPRLQLLADAAPCSLLSCRYISLKVEQLFTGGVDRRSDFDDCRKSRRRQTGCQLSKDFTEGMSCYREHCTVARWSNLHILSVLHKHFHTITVRCYLERNREILRVF